MESRIIKQKTASAKGAPVLFWNLIQRVFFKRIFSSSRSKDEEEVLREMVELISYRVMYLSFN